MSALGLVCAKTTALAPHVEISLINCISESQNILHTRGSMPRWRIVFSTFRECMSFHAGWVKSRHRALAGLCPLYPRMCCKTRLLLAIGFGGEFWPCPCPALPSTALTHRYRNLTPRLREAN